MKKDVEKQLPKKVEHIVKCNLSRRQRLLYDEYINHRKTQEVLQDADFFSIMNVLMQLRKVCNHPDLFDVRPIESPFFVTQRISCSIPKITFDIYENSPKQQFNYSGYNFIFGDLEQTSQQQYSSLIDNFPQRPLVQVIGEMYFENLGTLQTSRPLEEGEAVGFK